LTLAPESICLRAWLWRKAWAPITLV